MSVNGKFPEQLIAMVGKDMKASIKDEADRREISISQVVREKIEIADATAGQVRNVDGEVLRGSLDADDLFERIKEGDPETLAAYARNLAPDTEPDDVDGSLSDHEARVARLRARGLG
jgi:hypothetical protein